MKTVMESPATQAQASEDSFNYKDTADEEVKPAKKGGIPKGKAKAGALKKQKGSAATTKPSPKEKVDKGAVKEAARIASTLATHGKVAELLGEVTPNMIWRSTVRAAELERRMSKATSAREDLQKLMGKELDAEIINNVKTLDESLEDVMVTATSIKEISRIARQSNPESLAKAISLEGEFVENFGKCSHLLLKDFATLGEVLHAMAKKLVEALRPELEKN